MEDQFLETLLRLHSNNDWKQVLEFKSESKHLFLRKISWVWPSQDDIDFIKDKIRDLKCDGIISIGCGPGLLEWILHECLDIPVEGYEINEEWWKSKYSCPQFIELKFPEFPLDNGTMKPNFALLFCYFNNGDAFLEYIDKYHGDVVFIIGPGPSSGRYTDPQLFNINFGKSKWLLNSKKEIGRTGDYIALFLRDKCTPVTTSEVI